MDISDTLAPNSDQLDAVDLLGGPQVFTIERVSRGNAEQPVQIHLAEFPRPWRPGKSMRRVLVAIWGPDAQQYVGRRVKLWCDQSVAFGGQKVGGTRILAMSHMDKPRGVPLLITRGKNAMYTVDPLTEEAVPSPQPRNDQAARLTALIRESGMSRNDALPLFAGWIGREISGTKEMTSDETAVVVEKLSELTAGPLIPQAN